jgi:hypothetical protein
MFVQLEEFGCMYTIRMDNYSRAKPEIYCYNRVDYTQYVPMYNERWDFPTIGSSLFLPRFSLLTFLRFLRPFFIFSEIFTSGVL